MSDCNIIFEFNQEELIIHCKKNELMRDIISRFGTYKEVQVKKLYFLYDGNEINQDQTLSQINDKDSKIKILVLKCPENTNEITLKIKIEQNNVNNTIYFLDNTDNTYNENKNDINDHVEHKHDNLKELNENNTTLIINKKTESYKKYFTPLEPGIYTIKLIFKIKLTDCSYMFCDCNDIIDIDFSKFDTENVTDMKYMFRDCCSLTKLNLSSFNTQNVTNMKNMFANCFSLTTINLSSFDTKNVTDMQYMFFCCSGLKSLDLKFFQTENVTNMDSMFYQCESLNSLDLKSFNTMNIKSLWRMFNGCSSLKKLDLSSFNVPDANTVDMFNGCKKLLDCGSSDKNIESSFKNMEKV